MDYKTEALEFISSTGNKLYRDFLLMKFNVEMLFVLNFDNEDKLIFDGWVGSEMGGNWFEVENFETKTTIEFYETYYIIILKKNFSKEKIFFPFPRNINDFISDCKRCGVGLNYHMNAIEKYKPINILNAEDLNNYYNNILSKLNKL